MQPTGNDNQDEELKWENPSNPEKPVDARDTEQVERQHEEATRRKNNLSETDHIDKVKKN